MATQIKVKGIISFPHLFQARSINPTDDPKFSVTCLLPANDPQVAQIQQAIETEKMNTFPSGFPANGKLCLKTHPVNPASPGINEDPNTPQGYVALRMTSHADYAPLVCELPNVDQPLMDRSKVYAGAEAWFAVNIDGYNQSAYKGVGAYVNGVAVTGVEGPLGRIDNRPNAQQMFGDVADQTPPAATGPGPMAPSAPAPTAPAPTAPAPPAPGPVHQMTEKAAGATYEAMIAAGWTDETLIAHGMMVPPGGTPTTF